ncbi:unnamed protein product [Arctogadus glacialis]
MEALNTAHSGSMPPTSTGMPEKLSRRCELKIPRTGASSRRSQFTRTTRLGLPGPLGADPDWHVEYPDSFCVVEGSTATIPCSFTYPKVHRRTGVVVERVVWCPDYEICHGTTPYVYESKGLTNSRFLYLGDLVGNCTLKIIKTVKQDAATYRFRFETNGGGWTGQKGVRVNVTDGEVVKVRSSVTDHVVKEGGQVTLTCTTACSFHQFTLCTTKMLTSCLRAEVGSLASAWRFVDISRLAV